MPRPALKRLVGRHAMVGAFCALLNIAIIHVGTSILGQPYQLAAIATCFVTIPIAYFLLRRFSFRLSAPAHMGEFGRFVSQQLVQFLLGMSLLVIGVEWLELHPTVSIALATLVLWVFAFMSQWLWVFKRTAGIDDPVATLGSQEQRTHVVLVTPFFPAHGGGLERVAAELAARLRPGFRITWFSSDTDSPPVFRDGCVEAIAVRTTNVVERLTQLPYPLWSLSALPRLWRAIGSAQVLHVHEHIYFPSIVAIVMARIRGRPVVVTQHMGALALGSRLLTALYEVGARVLGAILFRLVDRVVFISDNVLRFFNREKAGNTRCIFNGVDTAAFRHMQGEDVGQLRRELGLPTKPRIVLFVGRFVRKKGIHRIEALAKLMPDVAVVFVGSGPERPDENVANIIIAGRVEHDRLPAYYRAADVLILPSSGEGFPLVVQEALCCGIAVLSTDEVATACPDSAPLIRTRPVPRIDDDIPGWQRALRDVLDDSEYLGDREYRSSAARGLWSWEKCASRYAALFRELTVPKRRSNDG